MGKHGGDASSPGQLLVEIMGNFFRLLLLQMESTRHRLLALHRWGENCSNSLTLF